MRPKQNIISLALGTEINENNESCDIVACNKSYNVGKNFSFYSFLHVIASVMLLLILRVENDP